MGVEASSLLIGPQLSWLSQPDFARRYGLTGSRKYHRNVRSSPILGAKIIEIFCPPRLSFVARMTPGLYRSWFCEPPKNSKLAMSQTMKLVGVRKQELRKPGSNKTAQNSQYRCVEQSAIILTDRTPTTNNSSGNWKYFCSRVINPFNASCSKLLLFEGSSAILV